MKTITVSVSEAEFNELALESTDFTLSEWINILSRELAKRRLLQSIELAEKYGLSTMSMDEINEEVKAVRKGAKDSY